jgi:GNAT superfamily N-acetyltransferase
LGEIAKDRLVSAPRVLPPERLGPLHDISQFQNGQHPSLDEWLREKALASEGLSARTYVVRDAASSFRVVGYHAISASLEQRIALPSAKLRRGMPDQVPLLLIGRLAVDRAFQGLGLGANLLADAVRRCLAAADIAGARAIVAHAIDGRAADFYQRHGFLVSPVGERLMVLPIETARQAIS